MCIEGSVNFIGRIVHARQTKEEWKWVGFIMENECVNVGKSTVDRPQKCGARPEILIVDDCRENLVALRRVLQEVDVSIVEALDGNQALTATLDHDFALAILDVQMPGMDGYELANLLHSDPKTATLPIIFLTAAYGEEEHIFKGYKAGAVDYIVKPYNSLVLLSKVRVFLELKRLNQDLLRRALELDTANRQLESFSYSVSHDLRAPLRAVRGFSDMLLEDYTDVLDDQGKDFLNRIRRGVDKMAGLIDDLLNLSKISRLEMVSEIVNLSALAHEVVHELRVAEPDRQVEIGIEDGLSAPGDERLLRIALSNLIGNAWKYTSKSPASRIQFAAAVNNERAVYSIRDNGAGFDMKSAQRLFEPFQRLHPESRFSGTGIGLAIVKRIVERHGGRIWAEAEPGKGAEFFFTLVNR